MSGILLSATQIKLFQECRRKWAFRYLAGIKPPASEGSILGTEVQNEQLDPWLGAGRLFDFSKKSGEIANALSALLPKPRTPGLKLRRRFEFPSLVGDFGYQGELDLFAPDSACVPGMRGGVPLLGDVKSTKNLDYALTPEKLLTDPQRVLYSIELIFRDGVGEHDAVWFYVRTRKPHRAQRVHLRVDPAQTVGEFEKLESVALPIVALYQSNPKPEDLPPDGAYKYVDGRSMCHSYGGCPYEHMCNLSPAVHAAAVNLEAKTVNPQVPSFIKGIRATTPAPVPVPAGTPGSFEVHAAGAESSLQKGHYVQPNPFAPPPATEVPKWATDPVDPMKARHEAARVASSAPVAPAAQQAAPAINPPESALPPAPPVGAAAPAAEKAKRGRPAKEPEQSSETVPVPDLSQLSQLMKQLGVRRVKVGKDGFEVELFDPK